MSEAKRLEGYIFELAKVKMLDSDEYCNWGEPQFSFVAPAVPDGAVRNLRPVYSFVDVQLKPETPLAAAVDQKIQSSRSADLQFFEPHDRREWWAHSKFGKYRLTRVVDGERRIVLFWQLFLDGRKIGEATDLEEAQEKCMTHYRAALEQKIEADFQPVEDQVNAVAEVKMRQLEWSENGAALMAKTEIVNYMIIMSGWNDDRGTLYINGAAYWTTKDVDALDKCKAKAQKDFETRWLKKLRDAAENETPTPGEKIKINWPAPAVEQPVSEVPFRTQLQWFDSIKLGYIECKTEFGTFEICSAMNGQPAKLFLNTAFAGSAETMEELKRQTQHFYQGMKYAELRNLVTPGRSSPREFA